MAKLAKFLQGVAGVGGASLNVEDVFSTYLYNGTATNVSHQIQNGIDLAGEGGLVWIKKRDSNISNTNHHLVDTERGDYYLASNSTNAQASGSDINTFNSDGWTFDASTGLGTDYLAAQSYASWTFRKAPKFFDVVTYTGDGTTHRDVPHNLGSTPGWVITKRLDAADNWMVYSKASAIEYKLHWLNTTDQTVVNYNPSNSSYNWTDTVFYASSQYSFANTNASGASYVSYLFANHDGDGDFGPTGDQDIIKCGSYTGNGSATGPSINLGFEPQWIIIKNTSQSQDWEMYDVMRGWTSDGNADQRLEANNSNAEATTNSSLLKPTATGFALTTTNSGLNASGNNYIYIAIRRGPMAVPESAADVFALGTRGASTPGFTSNFPVDMFHRRYTNGSGYPDIGSRLTGARALQTSETFAEGPDSGSTFDHMDGYYNSSSADSNHFSWMWRRAPNYFDVVAYTGDGVAGRTVSHNLGVAPEMIWVKRRNDIDSWAVYHSGFNLDGDNAPETDYGVLDNGNHFDGTLWNDTAPTATEFTVGFQGAVNDTFNNSYIAYLFASLDNVSKLGTYTGNGTSQTIDCGFSSGARFVLIKGSDSGGYGSDWYVWDTERGIVAGNDPHLSLNTTAAEVTTDDSIDPVSSGFAVNQVSATNINVSSATYIFYAIA